MNISGFSANGMMPRPHAYRVNGVDLALLAEEHMVNGLAVSLVGFGIDSMNGLAIGLIEGDAWDGNGIMLNGLFGLSGNSFNGISIAGLSQVNNRGNGIALSGLTTVYDSTFNGISFASVYQRNHTLFRGMSVTGTTQLFNTAKGISLCGLVTVAQTRFDGLQFSGICSATGESFNGFQLSDICSYTGEKFCGVGMAAVVNRVGGEAHGLLISAVNAAPVMQGVQIGVVNYANRLQGVQFGLINYNRANPKWCRVMPLINFNFRPLHETDTIRSGDSCYVLKSYTADGRIAGVSYYCNGKLNGTFTLYNQFHDKARETNYVNGKKEGEEFFFDGAGKITESNFWQDDTLVWSSLYDYPEYYNRYSYEKTIYYDDKHTEEIIFLGGDTLLRNTDTHFHVERESDETSEKFYKVFHYDTLIEIIWVVEKYSWIGYDAPEKDFIKHIRPGSIPPEGLVFDVEETRQDVPLQYLAMALERALRLMCGHAVPVTFEYKKHGKVREQFSFCGPLMQDMNYDEWRYPGFCKFDRKGRLRLQRTTMNTKVWYRSGQIRFEFEGDSDVVRRDGNYFYPLSTTRVSYYKNGSKAAYISSDSGFVWNKKGEVLQQETGLHAKRWYGNGRLAYEVHADSLMKYFDKRGRLRAEGRGDTVWMYAKNGALTAKFVFHGYDHHLETRTQQDSLSPPMNDSYTVSITHYRKGQIADTLSMDDYAFFYGEGARLENILLHEPGPRMIRYWERSEDEPPAYDEWFGMKWLDACSDIVVCRGAIESPVPVPRWLKRYYPDWEER